MAGKTKDDIKTENKYYEDVRKRLNKAINDSGWIQMKISKATGLSQTAISNQLTGNDPMNIRKIALICKAVGLDCNEILIGKSNPKETEMTEENGFVSDATNNSFQGYLGDYRGYFFSTVRSKGRLHDGEFKIYRQKRTNKCYASFSFKTGAKDPKTGEPVIKNFKGPVRLSQRLGGLCCELVDQKKTGDVSYIVFEHNELNNQQLECAIGIVVTICAGIHRHPVAHRILITRQKIPKDEECFIKGQLKLNDKTILLSEHDYESFIKDERLPDSFAHFDKKGIDILKARAKKQEYYAFSEGDIISTKQMSDEDLAKVINLMRLYSSSKNSVKVGRQSSDYVFYFLNEKKKAAIMIPESSDEE